MKYLPKDKRKIIITRFPPKIDWSKYTHLYLDQSLSPSKNLLLKYKKDNDWTTYIENFNNELVNRKDLINAINKLLIALEKEDVIIICYEKDYKKCHRYLIAEYLKKCHNVNWKEFNY